MLCVECIVFIFTAWYGHCTMENLLCSFHPPTHTHTLINPTNILTEKREKMTSTLFDRIGNCASIDSIYIVDSLLHDVFAPVARFSFGWAGEWRHYGFFDNHLFSPNKNAIY